MAGEPDCQGRHFTEDTTWRSRAGGDGLPGEVVTEHGDPPVADTEDLHE